MQTKENKKAKASGECWKFCSGVSLISASHKCATKEYWKVAHWLANQTLNTPRVSKLPTFPLLGFSRNNRQAQIINATLIICKQTPATQGSLCVSVWAWRLFLLPSYANWSSWPLTASSRSLSICLEAVSWRPVGIGRQKTRTAIFFSLII